MFSVPDDSPSGYTFLSLFSGAGGLDLGFEKAGFDHTESGDILPFAVGTMRRNRPKWTVHQCDVRDYNPTALRGSIDVLIGGFPCQGFSLGGNRMASDERNFLYREVVRIAHEIRPRMVVMENVLNLRTMVHPKTGKPFSTQIVEEMAGIGYQTTFQFFRVSRYGVPQTRRRFIFVACRDGFLSRFRFPQPEPVTTIRPFIHELGQDLSVKLPNHDPEWGFDSFVHMETGEPFDPVEEAVPVRLSRTASLGNPIRSFDEPFPAVDTATVWGWAQGNVKASRLEKNRDDKAAMFVRDPDSDAKLWRVSASRIRAFTLREYARLQTFPDSWVFCGNNKRELQLQVGNAVPVVFAKKIACSVRKALEIADGHRSMDEIKGQMLMAL